MCRENVPSNQYSLFREQILSEPQGEAYTFLVRSISRWFIQQFGYFIGLYSIFISKFFKLEGNKKEPQTTTFPSSATEASSEQVKRLSAWGSQRLCHVASWTARDRRGEPAGAGTDEAATRNTLFPWVLPCPLLFTFSTCGLQSASDPFRGCV